jgi:hypothetical protein
MMILEIVPVVITHVTLVLLLVTTVTVPLVLKDGLYITELVLIHVQKVIGIMLVPVNLVIHHVLAVLVLLTIVDVVPKVSAAQLKPIYITTLVSTLAQMDIMKIPPLDNVLIVTNIV